MSNEHDERLMEARTLNVTGLRLRDTNDTGDGMTLEGVAVPFNQRYALFSDYAEVIDPDCDFGTRKTVKVSREHGDLIGKLTDMRSEADGLHVVAKLADTESGREAAELVREGVYDGFSIGFRPVENRVIDSDDGVTEVHRRKVDLFEVAVTGIPAYPAAEITSQRSQTTTTNNESEAPSMGNDNEQRDVNERLEAFGEELRGIKATVAAGIQTTPPAELGGEFRTAGDYLKALSDERDANHAAAIDLMRQTRDAIVTGDTGNTVAWIADDLRLIEQRRKVTNILTRDTLPATGMSMEYNVVSEDTMAVDKQTAEGAPDLRQGEVRHQDRRHQHLWRLHHAFAPDHRAQHHPHAQHGAEGPEQRLREVHRKRRAHLPVRPHQVPARRDRQPEQHHGPGRFERHDDRPVGRPYP